MIHPEITGTWLTRVLDPAWMRWALGLSFIAVALWMLVPDQADDTQAAGTGRWGVFGVTVVAFFLAEMGDKTQIATVMLAARYDALVVVTAGTTLGMMIANVPAVLLGDRVAKAVPDGYTILLGSIINSVNPHMMKGLGFRSQDFERIRLLPAARRYRAWLEQISDHKHWVLGAAALTVFVEGSVKDRAELTEPSKPKTREEIETVIARHPLVRYHGLSPDHMDLIRAHQAVESGHRHNAYDMVVTYATTRAEQQAVLACLKKCLTLWLAYRDAVAKACDITKP